MLKSTTKNDIWNESLFDASVTFFSLQKPYERVSPILVTLTSRSDSEFENKLNGSDQRK